MKNSLLAITLLLLLPLSSLHAKKFEVCSSNPHSSGIPYWAPDSTVKVYFVRGMFTAAQSQTLREAMDSWTPNGSQIVSVVKFVYAGETGGLIDCPGCLTLARQGTDTKNRKSNASFHPLRQAQTGQLISAWIGLDSATSSPAELRLLILQAFRGDLGLSRC